MATSVPNNSVQKKRRVCVIGAGTAGLCTIRHCIEQGFDVVAYELANDIGGTWLYNDKLPKSQYEKVHSSLYEQLRTNLPKEIMGFPDFLYPDDCKESFIRAEDVLKFLKSYAEHFKLYPYIKFEHEVMRVRPRSALVPDWEVYARDLKSGKSTPAYFDFVFVCNGHYSEPMMPEIEGMDIYKGKQLHSHVYRKPSPFKDSKVLVIGAGPSGLDIAHHLNDIASAVYLSQHLKELPNAETQNSIIFKPDVERFTENGAIFKDGTQEEFSYVIYCTGYQYTFPCISTDSGFRVIDNWVHPLWKHVIVINNPTMALIGVPFKIIPAMSFDLQVRFALKYFTGEKELPSNEEMLQDMEKDMAMRKEKGWDQKLAHQMADLQFDYYDDLAETAGITKIKPVYYKMMKDCAKKYIYDFVSYRNYCYRLVDDESFVRFPMK